MSSFISLFEHAPHLHWRDYFDIILVTYLTYRVARVMRGTRAWTVLMGILAFSVVLWLAHMLKLRALLFLLDGAARIGPVALLVVFLPEVRQWVMEMGTGSFWRSPLLTAAPERLAVIEELVLAVDQLALKHIGALIVLEGQVGLDDVGATGRRLDSLVSSELIQTIFYPGSALHDGAVIVRQNRLIAAGCILPMPAMTRPTGRTAHTRHEAAMELARQTDAQVIVVSEESGSISLARNRSLTKGLTGSQLRERLLERLRVGHTSSRFHLLRRQ